VDAACAVQVSATGHQRQTQPRKLQPAVLWVTPWWRLAASPDLHCKIVCQDRHWWRLRSANLFRPPPSANRLLLPPLLLPSAAAAFRCCCLDSLLGLDTPWESDPGFRACEAGQVVLDRSRHRDVLEYLWLLNSHSNSGIPGAQLGAVGQCLWGDKVRGTGGGEAGLAGCWGGGKV
jgi:hypothetical protein